MQIERMRRGVDRRRRFRRSVAVLVSCAVFFVESPVARASTPSVVPSDLTFPAPQSGLGGYNWLGKVKEIGARWKVPVIYKNSRAGQAASWIGVQGDNANDFIQLGTLEELGLTGEIDYQAFWSDAAVNFIPQDLGAVKPGNYVVVQLVRKGFGWSLRLHDHASSLSVKRQIDIGFGDSFNQGEWIQENPSSISSGLPVIPYPAMKDVTFQDLTINGTAPKLDLGDGQVLITSSKRYRVPSRVRHDAFSMVLPTATQLRFLNDMRPSDLEAIVFGSEFSKWRTTSVTQRVTDVKTYEVKLGMTTKLVAHQVWPRASDVAVKNYVIESDAEITFFKEWSDASTPLKGSAFQRWGVSELTREYLADRVRESLGLPPTY